jgi:hypothetical protein
MSEIKLIIGAVAAIVLAALLWRQYLRESAKRAAQGPILFEQLQTLFDSPELTPGEAAGVWDFRGKYRNHHFHLKTVVDTLATRKLPSLWLMVTLPDAMPVHSTVDLMMRAAGLTTFSNFDFLPHRLATPEGFPEQATIRSDAEEASFSLQAMAAHLSLFRDGRGKEFLISPRGLRIVVQLSEADRLRYGVFREANFDGVQIDSHLAQRMMDTLINLRNDLHVHAKA